MSVNPISVKHLRNHSGFAMVEILIAFLVLAAGMLGVITVQKRGIDNSHAAYVRTQAVSLAQDMTSRIRANVAGHRAGNYNAPTATENANCQNNTGCSPANLAAHDYAQWQSELAQVLPAGEGVVCLDSTPVDASAGSASSSNCDGTGSQLVVKIWWDAIPKDGQVDQIYVTPIQL